MSIVWDDATITSWYDAFVREHGYGPDEDPNLLKLGYSPAEAISEHMRAAEFGAKFPEMYGRPPTEDDYRYYWFERNAPWMLDEISGRDSSKSNLKKAKQPYWVAFRAPVLRVRREIGGTVPPPPVGRFGG